MSSNSKLERVFTLAGVPLAGYLVTVTEANSNTWVRLYTREGSLISMNGETFTDSSGRVSIYVRNDRRYELTLRHKITRFPMMVLRSEESSIEGVNVGDSSFNNSSLANVEKSLVHTISVDGASTIPLVQKATEIALGNSLRINGLRQSPNSYSVNLSEIIIPADLNVLSGDVIFFSYFKFIT